MTSSAGSVTASKAFQYLTSSQTFANPSLYKFLVYDPTRQNVYLSATDHVDVFDLNKQQFLSPIEPPPNGPPPDAGLRGVTFTPDHSQLLVADFGAQSVNIGIEHGERLGQVNAEAQLAVVNGLTIVQLANVPLGIGTLNPATGAATGGVSVTVRGSGFQTGITATLGGKSAAVTLTDMNTLTLNTPTTTAGPQQLVLTNPDGESVSLDAAFQTQ